MGKNVPLWFKLAGLVVLAVMSFGLAAAALMAPVPSSTFVKPPETSSPTPSPEPPQRIAFLGDSWSCGGGLEVQNARGSANGLAGLTAKKTGWPYETFCVGGSGYTTDDTAYITRVPDVIAYAPNVVIVQGSTNDKGDEDETEDAAVDVLTQLREALPEARIVVVGPSYTPLNERTAIDRAREAIAAAAGAVGVEWVDPAAGGWLDLDGDFNPDGYHPKESGHEKISDRLAAILKPAT